MSQPLQMWIASEPNGVRLLVQWNQQRLQKTLKTPLHTLSVVKRLVACYKPKRLSVVLSVVDRDNGYGLTLFDALDGLRSKLPCEIGVVASHVNPCRFEDLQRLTLWPQRSLP